MSYRNIVNAIAAKSLLKQSYTPNANIGVGCAEERQSIPLVLYKNYRPYTPKASIPESDKDYELTSTTINPQPTVDNFIHEGYIGDVIGKI